MSELPAANCNKSPTSEGHEESRNSLVESPQTGAKIYYVPRQTGRMSGLPAAPICITVPDLSSCSRHPAKTLPYRPDITAQWFQQVVRRPAFAEPEDVPACSSLHMINVPTVYKTIQVTSMLSRIHLEAGDRLYYHGTDAQSAQLILENGIDLAMSRSRQDFSAGHGFYVTTDLERAVKWANVKAINQPGKGAAVIAFKISRDLHENVAHLSLEVTTEAGRKLWEKIVCNFRNGRYDPTVTALLQNVKFIEGPVNGCKTVSRGGVPFPNNFTQMCIREDDYAKQFGSLHNIYFVMFGNR